MSCHVFNHGNRKNTNLFIMHGIVGFEVMWPTYCFLSGGICVCFSIGCCVSPEKYMYTFLPLWPKHFFARLLQAKIYTESERSSIHITLALKAHGHHWLINPWCLLKVRTLILNLARHMNLEDQRQICY